jgi:hypothetical protein
MVALGVFAGAGEDVYRNDEASQLLRADHPDTLRRYALNAISTRYASGSRIE